MAFSLSEGAIETIMSGGEFKNPVVQVLGSKVIPGHGSNERYRLLISDGVHLNSFAMLATQLTPILTSGQLSENSIVKITNHVVSTVKNPGKGDKRIMVILDVEVLSPGAEVGVKIGNPVPLVDSGASSASTTAPSASTTASAAAPTAQPPARLPPKPLTVSAVRKSMNDTTLNSPLNTTRTHPIASLSPYQNGWTIKVRITNKSNIRTWSNARGEGKLFSVDLVDESGEIRATAFKEQCDKFYDMLEVNKIYYIARGTLKVANKQYSSLNNEYELTFNSETKIVPCLEDSASIPTLQFNFIPLSSIQDSSPGNMIDFIGVAKSAGDIVNLTSRTTNRELKKRDVVIVDQSLVSVTLTLWGKDAEDFSGDSQPIVAVKGGKVGEYNGGKTISLVGGSTLQVNPDIPEAFKLRGWFDYLTDEAKFTSLSAQSGEASGISGGKQYLIGEALDAKLGCGDKPDYFNCYATLMHVKTDRCVYKACPTPDCQKKVIDQNNGLYRCEKCNREYENFKYRLMLSANLGDFSGNQWVTLFQECAEELLGTSADNVGKWQEDAAPEFGEVFKKVTLYPFQFRLRAKMDNYNDESRLKMNVMSVKKPDYKERCKKLISEIKEMAGISLASH